MNRLTAFFLGEPAMNSKLVLTSIVVLACTLTAAPGFGKTKTVFVKVRADSEAPGYEAERAMDGNPATMWHTFFEGPAGPKPPHELIIDLGASYEISGFTYLPRPASGGGNGTIKEYEFYVSDKEKDFGKPISKGAFASATSENAVQLPAKVKGRYVRLRALSEINGRPWTSISGLRIVSPGVEFRTKVTRRAAAVPPVAHTGPVITPKDEATWQFATLQADIRNRKNIASVAHQTVRPEALILETDRDPVDIVLRRTAALLKHLRRMADTPDLTSQEKQLAELKAANETTKLDDADARLDLFQAACRLRREVAYSNPLLNFDKLLFIKRHRPGFNHMCDQYYGINAKPGGGVFVLVDPFGDDPQVHNVLADSVVQRGRLKGQKLEAGSFVAPDLSYDAKQIAFAYVECTGNRAHRFHTDATRGHWDPGWSYHLFRVNVDGTGLEQLTDGTWNDFDPCWLPNGRMAFITERRGGYLRCGRVCPTYTLYDMAPDGSDIRCLSYHETNEWHPSVTHDGRIIYTRWDYVDRHGCTAHLPWITTLDGRDSRAVHGNFAPRNTRPDMELDCRVIPGSHKFVATAAPHHGQAFGSLVLVDTHVEDDDKMAPVKRITPEVRFPESQGGAQVYGTAWPLSEDYYLCVYDMSMKPGAGRQGKAHTRGNYGIYLVDTFGNKELVYRDPAIACQSPMPLRDRPLPKLTTGSFVSDGNIRRRPELPETDGKAPEGTLAVVNVYDAYKPLPDDAKITDLRVIQILPMTVPSGRPPHEIGLREPSSRDSVILARNVLGTVPVEEDGSAHFSVPAGKEVYFQALDEKGLAVQSMRSATYLQPGEKLVCQGCHDRRHRAPETPRIPPIAMRRSPSKPKPDVDGSHPFSYPRLVQPVLDKHCVACHAKKESKTFDLSSKMSGKWYASYANLAPKYGFYNYGNGHRTTPGQFGAKASKLYAILQKGHYDVKLSAEEMHRITLWLDCCSVFYGVYEKEGGEAQLRGEVVQPTLQ